MTHLQEVLIKHGREKPIWRMILNAPNATAKT